MEVGKDSSNLGMIFWLQLRHSTLLSSSYHTPSFCCDWLARLNQGNGRSTHSSPHEVVISIQSGASWAIWGNFALLFFFPGAQARTCISSCITHAIPCEIKLWQCRIPIVWDQTIELCLAPRSGNSPRNSEARGCGWSIWARGNCLSFNGYHSIDRWMDW